MNGLWPCFPVDLPVDLLVLVDLRGETDTITLREYSGALLESRFITPGGILGFLRAFAKTRASAE